MPDLLSFSVAVALIAISLVAPSLGFLLRQWYQDEATADKKAYNFEPSPVDKAPVVAKETDLPDGSWSSEKHLALEKRGIFSKSWLYTAHISSFQKAGSYQSIVTAAGYPIFLIRGKDDIIRAFHNVCRHRAYSVTLKPAGASLVLGCRYHGWSYDTKGKLIKAPKFEEVPGFDKEANGLFEVRCYTDRNGLIYVNLDARDSVALVPETPSTAALTPKVSVKESWSIEGLFNWKFAEAKTAFSVPTLQTHTDSLFTILVSLFSGKPASHIRASLLSSFITSSSSNLVLSISTTPLSARKTSLQCILYSSGACVPTESLLLSIKQDILNSVKELESLHSEVCGSGESFQSEEQEAILAEVREHAKLERFAGKEIRPAARHQEVSDACKMADDLCKELEADTGSASGFRSFAAKEELSW